MATVERNGREGQLQEGLQEGQEVDPSPQEEVDQSPQEEVDQGQHRRRYAFDALFLKRIIKLQVNVHFMN